MWIKEPGKVTEGIDFLGTYDNCLCLLKGKEAMIVGGGMSWTGPYLEKQFSAMDFDPESLKYLVVLHSHFDHCGAVPYLRRKFPHMEVLASAYAAKVLAKERVVNLIAAANKEMIDREGLQSEYERLNLAVDNLQVDRVVGDDDVIDLGDGIEAHIVEVPGHSECSIAVYVPKLKALFPSDAALLPIDDSGQLSYPSPQYDFGKYIKSLEKLNSYEVEICAFEHHGVVIGELARKILREGDRLAEEFKDHVIRLYQQVGDLDKAAERLNAERLGVSAFDFINNDLLRTVAKAEIRSVLRYAGLLEEASTS